ncbi:MAG: DegV family protein [Eggerthellaceae bacterium]
MPYTIVTDSSCNLPEELIDELELEVLPLVFMIDDTQYQSYLKGEVTDLKQFYTMMREGKVITTSLPNLSDAEDLFESLLKNGNDILYLGFSSGLSGTYEGMRTIGNTLAERYPERTFVSVDTLAASVGQGLIVYYAAKKKQAGASLDEVAQWVTDNRLNLAHWFTVDDLMFLYRGGRVSRTAAFAGSLLNIKPVLHVDDEGLLIPMEKTRGRKKSIQALVSHMEETGNAPLKDQLIGISHGDCIEDVEYLQKLITEKFGVTNYLINYVDPVIGAHSGPGTLALFFLASGR